MDSSVALHSGSLTPTRCLRVAGLPVELPMSGAISYIVVNAERSDLLMREVQELLDAG